MRKAPRNMNIHRAKNGAMEPRYGSVPEENPVPSVENIVFQSPGAFSATVEPITLLESVSRLVKEPIRLSKKSVMMEQAKNTTPPATIKEGPMNFSRLFSEPSIPENR